MNPIEQLACSAIDAINRNDADTLINLFSDNFVYSDKALGITCINPEELRDFTTTVRRLFPNSQLEVVNAVADVTSVAVQWTLHATIQVPAYVGTRPKRIAVSGVSYVKTLDHKIDCWTDCYDRLDSGRTPVIEAMKGWMEL
ncbi:MAG: nuclear transport factor 2 family protein [Janthinobacterium lividum]